MIPEDRLLCALTRQQFRDEDKELVQHLCLGKIRWDRVLVTARRHGVAPLVCTNLERLPITSLGIDEAILATFRFLQEANRVSKQRQLKQIVEVVSQLKDRSIDVMVVKGAAMDLAVYDQPWYTTSADADLILRRHRHELSAQELSEVWPLLRKHRNLEFDFFQHHDITMNGVLRVDFQRIWNDAVPVRMGGCEVFMMQPEDMLIAACINSCRKRFFRLKSITDIRELIIKYPAMDWGKVCARAHEYNCPSIIYTALLVSSITLGHVMPPKVFDAFRVGAFRKSVLQRISNRLGFCAPPSIDSGFKIFGKTVGLSVVLPYLASSFPRPGRMLSTFVWELHRTHVDEHRSVRKNEVSDDIVRI